MAADGDDGESAADHPPGATHDHPPGASRDVAYVEVRDGDDEHLLVAPVGATLRDVLREAGLSPYARATERLNCGGRGLCATCGVRLEAGPAPEHWHDELAERFGYPRLSCQITVEGDLVVALADKLVWGRRE